MHVCMVHDVANFVLELDEKVIFKSFLWAESISIQNSCWLPLLWFLWKKLLIGFFFSIILLCFETILAQVMLPNDNKQKQLVLFKRWWWQESENVEEGNDIMLNTHRHSVLSVRLQRSNNSLHWIIWLQLVIVLSFSFCKVAEAIVYIHFSAVQQISLGEFK